MSVDSIPYVLILRVLHAVKFSMHGKVVELASVLKQNLPSILEVVELASKLNQTLLLPDWLLRLTTYRHSFK